MSQILEVKDLAFQTPDARPLIRGLSFGIRRGEFLAITGPNGIGKSTLLQILLGRTRDVSKGTVRWQPELQRTAYLPQLHNREFHIGLTLTDILSFSARLDPSRIEAVSHGLLQPKQLGLAWNTASGGERQKTLLTRLFMTDPEVLILDEPMNHLDGRSRQQLRSALREFIKDGQHTVIMVGHETNLDPDERDSMQQIDLKRYVAP